jgi:aminoglycoside 6'-N-acetyltransferase
VPYQFRPLSAADHPLLRQWLAAPHVAEWWGDPDQQFALIREDAGEAALEQYVVAVAARPIGYLQCYEVAAWPQGGLGSQPPGTCGIDLFIGEPDMLARGHGSRFIRAFVEQRLRAGAPRVLTDPSPANARAIRAYHKAGFAIDREVDSCDGRALLMIRDSQPTSAA